MVNSEYKDRAIHITLLMDLVCFWKNTSFLFGLVDCNEGAGNRFALNKQACTSLIISKIKAD